MPLFLINARDKTDSLDVRLATRAEHLEWAGASIGRILMAGPVFADDGSTMAGSTFVIEADGLAEAKAWAEQDPYKKAGLFDRVEVITFSWSIGSGPKSDG